MSDPDWSSDYRTFFDHFFGNYGYYIYNDLPADALNRLSGEELIRAKDLILHAIAEDSDERPIRAAGFFRLQGAAPILKRRFESEQKRRRLWIQVVLAWALFRIENDSSTRECSPT